MSESQHHHHHHHHHNEMDGATKFKKNSLAWIARKKKIEKFLKVFLIIVAIVLAIAVVVVYNIK